MQEKRKEAEMSVATSENIQLRATAAGLGVFSSGLGAILPSVSAC